MSNLCHNLKVLGGMRGMTALVWLGSAVDPDEVYKLTQSSLFRFLWLSKWINSCLWLFLLIERISDVASVNVYWLVITG